MVANVSRMARGVSPGAQGFCQVCQRHLQTVGDERHEDVRLDPVLALTEDLANLTLNTLHLPHNPENRFAVATQPTPLQRRAFQLLDIDPVKVFQVSVRVE